MKFLSIIQSLDFLPWKTDDEDDDDLSSPTPPH